MYSRFHSRLSLEGRDVAQPEGICIPLAPALHFTQVSSQPCFQPVTVPL